VGSRLPAHLQYAFASSQVTPTTGRCGPENRGFFQKGGSATFSLEQKLHKGHWSLQIYRSENFSPLNEFHVLFLLSQQESVSWNEKMEAGKSAIPVSHHFLMEGFSFLRNSPDAHPVFHLIFPCQEVSQ
jgi:hypothetical protein